MKRNVLSVDVFISTPGKRPECFSAAIEAIRDVNASTSDECPIIFNSTHWTDLRNFGISKGKTVQTLINTELIDKCDLALVIFGNTTGSRTANGLPTTFVEFLSLWNKQERVGNKRIFLAFHEGVRASSGTRKLARNKIVHETYRTNEDLKGWIRDFLKSRRDDFRSELFLTMPIQNRDEIENGCYLETNTSVLMYQKFADEYPILIEGREYPYTNLLSQERKLKVCDDEIRRFLSNCSVRSGDFVVADEIGSIRRKLFQTQFLLLLAFFGKLKDDKPATRFHIDQRSKGRRGVIQRTTSREQAVSNLAYFWPHTSTPGELTGKSGLSQEFRLPGAHAGAISSFIGEQYDTLHNLIASREHIERKLPPAHTEHLANTLGVAALVFLLGDRKQPILLTVKRTRTAQVFPRGIHMFASFALSWPSEASGKDRFDLWSFIRREIEENIRITASEAGLQNADRIAVQTAPLLLAREMMRGGKPQLFAVSVFFADDVLYNEIRARCIIEGHTHPEEIVLSREVTEEFRFAAAIYLFYRNNVPDVLDRLAKDQMGDSSRPSAPAAQSQTGLR
jgi:hypothetical protein